MKTRTFIQQAEDYRRVEMAIKFIENNFKSQPSLDEIAASAHVSKYHFQRLFKRWAGISPMQFMQFMTLDYARQKLSEAQSILDTSYDAGLSGPARLHDLFVNFEAMTPGEFKRLGAELKIDYGFHPTPFGKCLIAATERGICHLGFIDSTDRRAPLSQLQQSWPRATFAENQRATAPVIRQIFAPKRTYDSKPFNLMVKGTNFQVNVWKALLTIPRGCVTSYGNLATYIGSPTACRAVASAVAVNPVAYLIPCHRVIAGTGRIHRYRWGDTRKKAIIGWEAAASQTG